MNTPRWKKIGRMLSGTALKRWYKKYVSRRNRRGARQNPFQHDKKLDSWDLD
jgi:hypothetical protein